MHIPFLPEQVVNRLNVPSLSLADDVRGITAPIEAMVAYDGQPDIESIEGTIA